jgi:hypothetical protein
MYVVGVIIHYGFLLSKSKPIKNICTDEKERIRRFCDANKKNS